jgi:uncharacterized protein with HEPN domain
MTDKDLVRLKHMLDSINAILEFVRDKNRVNLSESRLLSSAIARELEILGEAAGRVSQETQDRYPQLPWRQIIGMRNRLIHAYFDIDYDIIWRTIHQSLPTLQNQIEKVVSDYK